MIPDCSGPHHLPDSNSERSFSFLLQLSVMTRGYDCHEPFRKNFAQLATRYSRHISLLSTPHGAQERSQLVVYKVDPD